MGPFKFFRSLFEGILGAGISEGEKQEIDREGGKELDSRFTHEIDEALGAEVGAGRLIGRAQNIQDRESRKVIISAATAASQFAQVQREETRLEQHQAGAAASLGTISREIQELDESEEHIESRNITINHSIQALNEKLKSVSSRMELERETINYLIQGVIFLIKAINERLKDESLRIKRFFRSMDKISKSFDIFDEAGKKIESTTQRMRRYMKILNKTGITQIKFIIIKIMRRKWSVRRRRAQILSLRAAQIPLMLIPHTRVIAARISRYIQVIRKQIGKLKKEIKFLNKELRIVKNARKKCHAQRKKCNRIAGKVIKIVKKFRQVQARVLHTRDSVMSFEQKNFKPHLDNIELLKQKLHELYDQSIEIMKKHESPINIIISEMTILTQIFAALHRMAGENLRFHDIHLRKLLEELKTSLLSGWNVEKGAKVYRSASQELIKDFKMVNEYAAKVTGSSSGGILRQIMKVEDVESRIENELETSQARQRSFFIKEASEIDSAMAHLNRHIRVIQREIDSTIETQDDTINRLSEISDRIHEKQEEIHRRMVSEAKAA